MFQSCLSAIQTVDFSYNDVLVKCFNPASVRFKPILEGYRLISGGLVSILPQCDSNQILEGFVDKEDAFQSCLSAIQTLIQGQLPD